MVGASVSSDRHWECRSRKERGGDGRSKNATQSVCYDWPNPLRTRKRTWGLGGRRAAETCPRENIYGTWLVRTPESRGWLGPRQEQAENRGVRDGEEGERVSYCN